MQRLKLLFQENNTIARFMHLLDCFTELMVYVNTLLCNKNADNHENTVIIIDKVVERSKQNAIRNNFDDGVWKEGFFPVAAWIDESILCSGLPWKEQWIRSQLQRKYFNINNAGELFFQKLDNMDALSPDALAIYELVLATGFQGVHYQNSESTVLTDIRNTISARLNFQNKASSAGKLFDCAYQQQAPSGKIRKRSISASFNLFNIAVVTVPVFVLVVLHLLFEANLDRLIEKYYGKVQQEISRFNESYHGKAQ